MTGVSVFLNAIGGTKIAENAQMTHTRINIKPPASARMKKKSMMLMQIDAKNAPDILFQMNIKQDAFAKMVMF